MAETRILLARHGHATSGPDHRWTRDDPLTELGRGQARELAASLAAADVRPTRLVASPALRAVSTAEPCAAALGLELEIDERLVEFGSAGISPFTLAELLERDPYDDVWHPDDPCWDGETVGDFWRRTAAVADEVAASGGVPLVVSHGGTTIGILRWALGIEPARPDAFAFRIANASISELRLRHDRHGRRRTLLERLSDTGHLSRITEL